MHGSLVNADSRSLGKSNLKVGALAYGCWRFTTNDLSHAQRLIESALDHGMNMIDTADVYGLDYGGSGFGASEELLGRVLAGAPRLRDRMVLATKGGIAPPIPYDSSPRYLREACEASLTRIGADVIDLYQIHRPDLFTHPAEVAATLTALQDEGKIREVGVSNHTPAQQDTLASHLPFPLAASQPEYSITHLAPMRDGTFDLCMRDGVVPLSWSPLAGGRLITGEGIRPQLLAALDRLAEREGVDRSAICLAFVLAHPSAPVAIVGTQTIDRVEEATAALRVTLTRTDLYQLIEACEGVPLP
ncbi:MAG: aldo/keto reductase [Actinobacteria bacterium]|nr:aldo/keto reductase [Actinomycetota bacterium]